MTWAEVFDADPTHQLPHRTWWWWWYIFFFRNSRNPARTKQMVLLWGTRNSPSLIINGHRWDHRQDDLVRNDHSVDCGGMTAGWWYDGERMHDPLFVDDGRLHTEWDGGGRLVLENGNRYEFDALDTPQRVAVKRRGLQIELELRPWTEYLSRIVPTGKRYLSHLGYQMHKIRGSKVSGSIEFGGGTERLEGTAYFQKVRINSPTSPWYWGVFHARDGSYLDYFMPHLGPPALRRTARHDSPWDWGERYLSNSFQFYEGATGELHRIKGVTITKRYEDDLPIFQLRGEAAGRSVDLEMSCYARATWIIQQPVFGPLTNVLHYNEYPANVTAFEFQDGSRRVTLADIRPVVGNCEHSWGLV